MYSVTLQEAEGHLGELAKRVTSGESVVIHCQDGSQLKLVVEKPAKRVSGERVFGRYEGQGWMSDDFDDELPESFWLSDSNT
ncbi:MAG: type II toxin-antitoxin system prevent-host-death family antitoxin [Alteromonadaceae bacterium]|nr:MAG: type II toxin-antitoxin system prevent-host-death family antitoxin [Alteromonadaceae bacterium]